MQETDLQTAVDAEISTAWATIQQMIDWSVSFLPKLVIGIVVFVLFWLIGKGVRFAARRGWWTGARQHEVLRVQHEVIATIKETLSGAGIDLPFPTTMVLFHDQTEQTDGDRTRQREGWPAGRKPPRQKTIAGSLERRLTTEGKHGD